ncbi:sterol desaturase family protein [uncultured Sphingorhabdus sp.]|uniref:sterol desaturase family protein n=1 Tax=uncultured Sphingorhabdus sp. TaxID=1686106 RepID=UPI0026231FDC|nr:sterol desaturase family protein [uncultured Sphingorhabdus sp.]HMS21492.1 sterol desaturase family protein [Sphingorhabdus sp.]
MKQSLLNLLPPATVAAILAFWAFAPVAWVENWWTITAVGLVALAFVQLMEFVAERHVGWRINRQELLTDLFYVLLGLTAISWVSDTFAHGPLEEAKIALGLSTPWMMELPFLVQVAIVMLLIEFGQYWMHRWMHNNAFLWSTHAPHHHITQLNAMKGYVGNPIELFLISLSVIALLDFDKAPMFAAFNSLGVISFYAHANVRADPPQWFSFFFTTIQHHSLHHTAESFEDTRCNYGNCVILFDRMFGTFREGESAIAGQDDRKRLTIREQFLFPFQPWIDRRRARQT